MVGVSCHSPSIHFPPWTVPRVLCTQNPTLMWCFGESWHYPLNRGIGQSEEKSPRPTNQQRALTSPLELAKEWAWLILANEMPGLVCWGGTSRDVSLLLNTGMCNYEPKNFCSHSISRREASLRVNWHHGRVSRDGKKLDGWWYAELLFLTYSAVHTMSW